MKRPKMLNSIIYLSLIITMGAGSWGACYATKRNYIQDLDLEKENKAKFLKIDVAPGKEDIPSPMRAHKGKESLVDVGRNVLSFIVNITAPTNRLHLRAVSRFFQDQVDKIGHIKFKTHVEPVTVWNYLLNLRIVKTVNLSLSQGANISTFLRSAGVKQSQKMSLNKPFVQCGTVWQYTLNPDSIPSNLSNKFPGVTFKIED